jgi:hypothetical protein
LRRIVLVSGMAGLLAAAACTHTTRTVLLGPNPELRDASVAASTETLRIPPGHFPDEGECRVWIPGAPPGRQPRPKSRPCAGIESQAPAGSWIVYRPMENRKVVYVREVDANRPGLVIRTRIFDIETTRLLREETP